MKYTRRTSDTFVTMGSVEHIHLYLINIYIGFLKANLHWLLGSTKGYIGREREIYLNGKRDAANEIIDMLEQEKYLNS